MRIAIVILSFLPFVYFGVKDNAFHFRGRKVSRTEHILHFGIGATEAMLFTQALAGNTPLMFASLFLFMISGGVDEYIFHRQIPGEESDLHAKEHLALLIFIVIAIATIPLEKNNWHLPDGWMGQIHSSRA
jgi:hypothetical protein